MIDEISLKILKILQKKARIPNVEVARQVGLAPSAVLERIRPDGPLPHSEYEPFPVISSVFLNLFHQSFLIYLIFLTIIHIFLICQE